MEEGEKRREEKEKRREEETEGGSSLERKRRSLDSSGKAEASLAWLSFGRSAR